jgi:hypothetical protein
MRMWSLAVGVFFVAGCPGAILQPGCDDKDGDGAFLSTSPTSGCFPLDCNDDDPEILPDSEGDGTPEDPAGDGLDQNCDGRDGTLTYCGSDLDCPSDQPRCNGSTGTCELDSD